MEESLLPSRPVAARSAINMTTTANDILPRFTNDDLVIFLCSYDSFVVSYMFLALEFFWVYH